MTSKEQIRLQLQKEGFAKIGFLSRQDAQFSDWIGPWLEQGFHAEMSFMEDNAAIRIDPCSIEPFGKSIISCAYPYFTRPSGGRWRRNAISSYAWGADYHKVLKQKIERVILCLQEEIPGFQGRGFVDTAPIPEKIVAKQSGLGWIGKNGLLINQQLGSYFFLTEIVCNLDLQSDSPMDNHCDDCDKCVRACPSGAINGDGYVDSNRCISYLTIEKRGEFKPEESTSIGYQVFGCDICQQVCHWNQDLEIEESSPFECYPRWRELKPEDYANMDQEEFDRIKIASPVKRAKLDGLRRNARTVLANRVQEK